MQRTLDLILSLLLKINYWWIFAFSTGMYQKPLLNIAEQAQDTNSACYRKNAKNTTRVLTDTQG